MKAQSARRTKGQKRVAELRRIYVLIDTAGEYGTRLFAGFARFAARMESWQVLSEEASQCGKSRLAELKRNPPDALVVRSVSRALTEELIALKIPMLDLNEQGRRLQDGSTVFPMVRTDDSALAHAAIDHFYGQGVRKVLLYYDATPLALARKDAFLAAAYDYPILVACHKAVSQSPLNEDFSRETLRAAIGSEPGPIAIWAVSDPLAARALALARQSHVRVPDQMAVLGTGNGQAFCRLTLPRLSSIDLAPDTIGYEAARYLARLLNGDSLRCSALPVGETVVRQSSNLFAFDDPDAAAIIRYIQVNATSGLKVADVQRQFDLIPRTLQRIAQKYFGHTIEEEIRKVKLRCAKELLADPEINIHDVARLAGYASTGHFARSFVRDVGMCPRTFQKHVAKSGLPDATSAGD
ncbi:MAG: substrate-binding domain-containing protein [Planctomycetia bacterium]|nr:substrate-binding domain-containing protein [Planctomycetia bacterium]